MWNKLILSLEWLICRKFQVSCLFIIIIIRVSHKVRKTRHQYPEFGPKPDEIIKKKPAKKVH
jgi:hypothetical protein